MFVNDYFKNKKVVIYFDDDYYKQHGYMSMTYGVLINSDEHYIYLLDKNGQPKAIPHKAIEFFEIFEESKLNNPENLVPFKPKDLT